MQKIIYKLIIAILLFVLSAGYFISNIKETSYTDRVETTRMSDASYFMVMGRSLTALE